MGNNIIQRGPNFSVPSFIRRSLVKRFALCYRTVGPTFRAMSKLLDMPLGTEVGLGPGHIVLGGDPLLSPCLLWPNGWMDQDATWYGDRS